MGLWSSDNDIMHSLDGLSCGYYNISIDADDGKGAVYKDSFNLYVGYDIEPNDNFKDAVEVIGTIEWSGFAWWETDFYNISLNPSEVLELVFGNEGGTLGSANISIYNDQHVLLNTTTSDHIETIYLNATSLNGIYYFSVDYQDSGELYYNLTVLNTSPGDNLELNNDFATATPLTLDGSGNPIEQLTIVPAGDIDYFKIHLNQGDNIYVLLWNLPANYDLALFYPNQALIVESKNSGTMDDQVLYNNAYISGNYYIRVSDAQNYAGIYNLTIYIYIAVPNPPIWEIPPVTINNNWSSYVSEDWCSGLGTYSNPYVIQNVSIDGGGSGSCFSVLNSRDYFVIFNSTFYNSGSVGYDAGIYLENTTHGTLLTNNCSLNNHGICSIQSFNNTFEDNLANNNSYSGIFIDPSDFNTVILNNANFNNLYGIYIEESNNNR
ncbi:hypothetical protein ES705_22450 [subsurface metagenome]